MPAVETALDDAALLATFVKEQCHTPAGREALGELCRRHLDFVFGVARRAVRDPGMAEDVAQAVLLILARKAGTIRHAEHLQSWLFRTTRYTAANAIKMAARRKRHETKAARQEGADMRHDSEPSELVYQLDDALAQLPQPEREVILARYFRGQEYDQIASSLNLSEPATRKRLSRGMERLREILGRRNTVTASILATTLTLAGAERASAAVAQKVIPAVTAGHASDTAMALASMSDNAGRAAIYFFMAAVISALVGVATMMYVNAHQSPPAPPAEVEARAAR